MKRGLLESNIQSAILDYLLLRKHFVLRLNNIPAFNRNADGSIRMRRLPKGATRGMADVLTVAVGRPYFLEVKRPGTYHSFEQKDFQARAEKAGALYYIVRSIEDVQRLGL